MVICGVKIARIFIAFILLIYDTLVLVPLFMRHRMKMRDCGQFFISVFVLEKESRFRTRNATRKKGDWKHLWDEVLQTIFSPARENPGPNLGARCNSDSYTCIVSAEGVKLSGSSGTPVKHSADWPKGLTH